MGSGIGKGPGFWLGPGWKIGISGFRAGSGIGVRVPESRENPEFSKIHFYFSITLFYYIK